MKKIILMALISFVAMISCKNKATNSEETIINHENKILNNEVVNKVDNAISVLGSYVGNFGDNKITLLITRATADSVGGRSIVGGFDRPFEGTLVQQNNEINITAKEPGSDKHDGTFSFKVNTAKPNALQGNWTPFKETPQIKSKEFSLSRKTFEYNKSVGDYPQASTKLLTEADVNNLLKPELEQMRNEIFARHGYCFSRKAIREQFENFDWYIPNSTDVKNDLTDVEKKNIALIKKFEKYADDYGDDFGR
jgi:YARHG domain